jgi:hypothetical protein
MPIPLNAQSSRLAEFGGVGMSFNICRGTLDSLAMFTAIRNASSAGESALSRYPTSANTTKRTSESFWPNAR